MNENKFSEKAVRDSWESEIVHLCVLGVLGTEYTRYFVHLRVLSTECTKCTR